MSPATIPPSKRCSKCGEIKPTTAFTKRSVCKSCDAQRAREYYTSHRDERAAYNKQYQATRKEETKKRNAIYRANNLERIKQQQVQYHAQHREVRNRKSAEYLATHREENRQHCKQYYFNHREALSKKNAIYRASRREEASRRTALWYRNNREKGKVYWQQRRTRKQSLPLKWTIEDERKMLNWFHGACAYCNQGPSLFDLHFTLHADHFIPLNHKDCPGTIPANMLPACQNCNLNKKDKDPYIWLIERFGKRKVKQIAERIEAYFNSLRNEEQS